MTATRVWVVDPSNPTSPTTSGTSGSTGGGGQRLTTVAQAGVIRNYASGRVRAVFGPTTNAQATVTLRALTPAQVRQVEALATSGTVLCFRDTYGQKLIGVIFGTQRYYIPLLAAGTVEGDQFIDLALTINTVTVPPGT